MKHLEIQIKETKEDFVKERKQMIEKNDSSFHQIKSISSQYLLDFDIRIEEIEE